MRWTKKGGGEEQEKRAHVSYSYFNRRQIPSQENTDVSGLTQFHL